jgi:hypothetical protein
MQPTPMPTAVATNPATRDFIGTSCGRSPTHRRTVLSDWQDYTAGGVTGLQLFYSGQCLGTFTT